MTLTIDDVWCAAEAVIERGFAPAVLRAAVGTDKRRGGVLPLETWRALAPSEETAAGLVRAAARAREQDERGGPRDLLGPDEGMRIVRAVAIEAARARGADPLRVSASPGGEVPIFRHVDSGDGWRKRVATTRQGEWRVVSVTVPWCARSIRVCPPRGEETPLGWAVAAWTVLRPAPWETGERNREVPPALPAEPVVVTTWVSGEPGEEGAEVVVAWGDLKPQDAVRVAREAKGYPLDAVGVEAELARFIAAAERTRDAEKTRLPLELECVGAALRQVRQAADLIDGVKSGKVRGIHGEAEDAARQDDRRELRRAAEYLRHVAEGKADGEHAVRLRAMVRASAGWQGDGRRRDRTRAAEEAGTRAWADAARAAAAADIEAELVRAEVERWRGFADDRSERAGRRAAARLLCEEAIHPRGPHPGPGAWRRWGLRALALAEVRRMLARRGPQTADGKEALRGLLHDLGLGVAEDAITGAARPLGAGEEANKHEVAKRGRGDAEGKALRRERDDALAELRVAADEAAGLRVTRCRTMSQALRESAGVAVALSVGRGEGVYVADLPPRVLAGPASALARAGYDRLECWRGAAKVSRSVGFAHASGGDGRGGAVLSDGEVAAALRVIGYGVLEGLETTPADAARAVAATWRTRGGEATGPRWLPADAPASDWPHESGHVPDQRVAVAVDTVGGRVAWHAEVALQSRVAGGPWPPEVAAILTAAIREDDADLDVEVDGKPVPIVDGDGAAAAVHGAAAVLARVRAEAAARTAAGAGAAVGRSGSSGEDDANDGHDDEQREDEAGDNDEG